MELSQQVVLVSQLIQAILNAPALLAEPETARGAHASNLTTLMVRNIPRYLTQKQFLSAADFSAFLPHMNFFYLPADVGSGKNMGYAFINFENPESALLFKLVFHNKTINLNHKTAHLTVTYATIQGLDKNIEHLQSSHSIQRIRNHDFLPLVRSASQFVAWHC